MTEVKTYRCNRCGKTFQKDIDEKPSEVKLLDQDVLVEDVTKDYDLCEGCVSTFYDFN